MAYTCPRCNGPVSRHTSAGAAALGGLVGGLFSAAFGGFNCAPCGPIKKAEFPAETQHKMTRGSILMSVGALTLATAVIALLVLFKR